jgi:hypothetical protein
VRFFDTLKKLVDPLGPVGQWLSPSEVYKDRLGLPIQSPHTMRAMLQAPADIERALAPSRFVAIADAVDVPKSRTRQVSAFIEEHWSPVYASTTSTDMFEILKASKTQVGWRVTQQQTASSRARMTDAQFIEQAQTLQFQTSDEIYNGYFETIRGNDPIEIDGKILTGGTRITGGRAEYRAKTKDYVHWDKGFIEKRQAALAEEASRPVRNVKANLERVAGECLPMRRLLPNARYDRKSAC